MILENDGGETSVEGEIRRGGWMKRIGPPIVMLAVFWVICIVMQQVMGGTFAGPSGYNSYTLQAMAWREGKIALGRDYPHLELAIFENDWYVSFPPVPTIPMYLLTFIFGADTPDALMVKLYAMVALLAIYGLLAHMRWNRWQAAFMALMMVVGGSMLPLLMNGAVWYQAQTLAFMLTAISVALMMRGRTTGALVLYALAVGCRPFNVCYGPLLMAVWYLKRPGRRMKTAVRKLWPGIALGLCVAAAYAAYNYVRFGNPLEFGHNYLPEFTRSENGQFSIKYLAANAKRFLLGLPVYRTETGWEFEKFGSSVFLGNPMLMLLVVWYAADIVRGRANAARHLTMAAFAVHLFLLLLHRTGGGFQLGARYAVDLTLYALIYLGLRREKRGTAWWEAVILTAGFALMAVGSTFVHI